MLKSYEMTFTQKRKYNPVTRTVRVDAQNSLIALSIISKQFKNIELKEAKEIKEEEDADSETT